MARPWVVHLIGHPGVGKLTIARALARVAEEEGEAAVVVDNHLTANAVFAVVGADGVRPLPEEVWGHIGAIREVVFRAMEELSPPPWSFVLTNVLLDDDPGDAEAVARIARLADRREAAYVPVRLACETDENLRRVTSPERAERMKWIDPEGVRRFVAERRVLRPDTDHVLDLDVTALGPDDAARIIWRHATAAARSGGEDQAVARGATDAAPSRRNPS